MKENDGIKGSDEQKALMIHVEKAVRPLAITQFQCNRIREELLSHLQDVYNEELDRCGDHAQAIERATVRFGSPKAIREELCRSLPWYSGVLAKVPWFARLRRWPESSGRVAWRGWMTAIWFWVAVGVPWCGYRVAVGEFSVLSAAGLWVLLAAYGIAILVPFVQMTGSLFGVFGLRQSIAKAVLFAVIGSFAQACVLLSVRALINPELPLLTLALAIIVPAGLFGLLLVPEVARSITEDAENDRRTGEWELLELES